MQFAGRISSPVPKLGTYLEAGDYPTRWTDTIDSPGSNGGDYPFAPAAADNDYRTVMYRERDRGDVTGRALSGTAAIGAVAVVVWALNARGCRQTR